MVKIINLEAGMPTVEQAQIRLLSEIRRARAERATAVKIIHGYGSSGVGGKLRIAMRSYLAQLRRSGKVGCYVAGEDWSVFHPEARELLNGCPELKRDRDLEHGNPGVTIALL
jgi:hypothetical protein